MKNTRSRPVLKPAPEGETKNRRGNYSMDDIPAIFGIAPEEVTPRVKEAFIKLASEIDRLETRVSELETVADEDPLVPVMNRRAFERELARTIAYSARYHTRACLVFFDIDDFKSINDRFGHAAGDLVLRHVGRVLAGNTRKSDIVGRIGGDEFAVVLMQSDLAAAAAKTRQLVNLLANTPVPGIKANLNLRLSAGIAAAGAKDSVQDILARADRDMYASKTINAERPASA